MILRHKKASVLKYDKRISSPEFIFGYVSEFSIETSTK